METKTSDSFDEFKQRLVVHAKNMTAYADRQMGEAATNIALVQPFLVLLGYDITNPDEVAPEHHADFSEKYKNKVDYAIMRGGAPVIAVESKKVGGLLKDDLGQLRSYFNACPSVKLGILTDGLRFEFYADSESPNMMDDTAFLKIFLLEVAKGNIDENSLKGLFAIRKAEFNPENVGSEAKRKLLIQFIVQTLQDFKINPPDDFIRLFLTHAEISGRVTKKSVDGNRQVVKDALQSFIDQEILSRVGYAPKDVIKKVTETADIVETTQAAASPDQDRDDDLDASAAEIAMYDGLRERLAFLVKTDEMLDEIKNIHYKKTKNSFRVFYNTPNKGVLFAHSTNKQGDHVFKFIGLDNKIVETKNLRDAGEPLLQIFTNRLREFGVPIDKPAGLRAVT